MVNDGGYERTVKNSNLNNTVVFGVKSDKVYKDFIVLGNLLTFNQVYNLAKVEESTKVQRMVKT